MSKELTEKWENSKLEYGYYYLQTKDGERRIDRTTCDVMSSIYLWTQTDKDYIQEVLSPVPSYDHFSQLVKKVEQLQEQLKEATHTIYCIANTDGSDCKTILETIIRYANLYLEKWGVK